jgi:hypothetical protein
MKQAIAVVLILLAWIGSAKAWSEDGHRIVCAIAWKELAPETRALVEDLLKEDPASGFAEACVWADAIRSDPAYDWAKPHHYINVPAGAAGIDLARDCPPEIGCIMRAIAMHIGTLRQPKVSAADKAQALRFLTPFVGNVHQPLHVGRAEDRGGTAIKVRFLGEEISLYEVWDGGLIAGMVPNWQTLADRLHASILDAEHVTWQRSDVHDWAEESRQLAEVRAYVEPEDGWILGQDYIAQNALEVAEQLRKAGVRLAWVLQAALGQPLDEP